jgi:hypothetical protein
MLPGFSGQTPVPVTHNPVKGKLERALRRFAQRSRVTEEEARDRSV